MVASSVILNLNQFLFSTAAYYSNFWFDLFADSYAYVAYAYLIQVKYNMNKRNVLLDLFWWSNLWSTNTSSIKRFAVSGTRWCLTLVRHMSQKIVFFFAPTPVWRVGQLGQFSQFFFSSTHLKHSFDTSTRVTDLLKQCW